MASGDKTPVSSGAVYTALQDKQDTLIVDSTPTQGHSNPISSDAVYTALAEKQNLLTAGTGITIDSNNVISTSGGSAGGIGWTSADIILSEGSNIAAVSMVNASYCAALGLVRFLIVAMAYRISTASPTSPGVFEIAFASTSKYKPSCIEMSFSGSGYSEGIGYGSVSGYYDTEVVPCAIVSNDGVIAFNAETKRDHGANTSLFLSGFYYTEDIPTSSAGGES